MRNFLILQKLKTIKYDLGNNDRVYDCRRDCKFKIKK
jgi:hypothetical protein